MFLSDSIWDTTFVALDLETTGLSPRSCGIVEIGALKFKPGQEGVPFQKLVNPCCEIPESASRVHGITFDQVCSCPSAEEVVPELLDFIGDCPLVLHNAPFDMSFLTPIVVSKLGRRWSSKALYDTLPLSKVAFKGLKCGYSLEKLSVYFNFERGGHHRAVQDCWYTQALFTQILNVTDPMRCFDANDFAEEYGDKVLLGAVR